MTRWVLGSLMGLALLTLPETAQAQGPSDAPLTTARSIRDLSPEQAALSLPVKFTATVTLQPPDRTIFLQDGTGGTFIRSRADLPIVKSGQVITVEAVTYPGLYVPGIDARSNQITVVGTADFPAPTPASASCQRKSPSPGRPNCRSDLERT
jgi:hypothetical protein